MLFELNYKTGKGGETEMLDSMLLHTQTHTPIVFYIFSIKVVVMHAKPLQ